MRDPAPPYANEGPHALWHVSENPAIERFEPHVSATAEHASRSSGPSTRAICRSTGSRATARAGRSGPTARPTPPTRHDCWATPTRVHAIEEGWLDRHAHDRRLRLPPARDLLRAAPGGRRLLDQPRRRSSRSTAAARRPRRRCTRTPGSSCASCRTSGRSGTTSSRRRSSSAACGCATRSPPRSLGERALLRDPGAAREAGRRRAGLAEDEEPRRRLLEFAGEPAPRPSDRVLVRRRPDPEDARRRPPRPAAGTTRRPPAAARAPSRPRPRRSRSAAPRRGPRRPRGSGARPSSARRNSVLRRSASSSVTSRSGSDTASGIPGVPPPEPTSTIGPS